MANNSRLINNKIDDNAIIWNWTDITDSQICKGGVISDFAQLRSSIIGENVNIGRRNTVHHSTIGKNTYTGEFCMIKYAEIGKYCAISWNVSIGGANHDISTLSVTPIGNVYSGEPIIYDSFNDAVEIGNDVWIAAGSHVLRGVSIGDGAVIGANSVVTHDVPPYTIVAGSPARIIRKRFDDNTARRLQSIRWWDFSQKQLNLSRDCFGKKLDGEILLKLENIAKMY